MQRASKLSKVGSSPVAGTYVLPLSGPKLNPPISRAEVLEQHTDLVSKWKESHEQRIALEKEVS